MEHPVFGHTEFYNICLTDAELERNHFPTYKHLAKGFILLPPNLKKGERILAVDCEFCRTTIGLEVVRVILVDKELNIILDEFVKPKGEVTDLLTELNGIQSYHIENAKYTLPMIQQHLCQICDQNTVIVGNGLDCDLKGLKFIHFQCADTKVLYNCGPQNSIKHLARNIFRKEITKPADYPVVNMMLCLFLNGQPRRLAQGGFGSKQALVTRVHSRLLSKYQSRLVVPLTSCLRGKDSIRIHCKKWDQLLAIEELIENIDNVIPFYQICLPISMKTKSQKKGFFVYLKFYNTSDVQCIFELISSSSRYSRFKAEVADRPTSSKKSKKSSETTLTGHEKVAPATKS